MDTLQYSIIPIQLATRTCTKCGLTRTLDCFWSRYNRKGLESHCKDCKKCYQRSYRAKDRARFYSATQAWRNRNREHIKEYNRQYRAEHAEELSEKEKEARANMTPEERVEKSEKAKEYYHKNRDILLKNARGYYFDNLDKNREDRQAYSREWTRKNPDKRQAQHALRKARKRNPDGVIESLPSRNEILSEQGGMCAYCKAKGKSVEWHLDHIMPLARGGHHTADNVQVLCAPCNMSKKAKHPLDFASEQGRLL